MALLHFYKANPDIVLTQTIQQIVSNAGDGNLCDASLASLEFRDFLKLAPSETLFIYARQCLESPFQNSGYVLQDIVNELGRRLDFEVEDGLYRGKQNAVGFDGLWQSKGEPELIVEVKTTDAYTIRLDTTNNYRKKLIETGRTSDTASILIVVGRADTDALEAQVRGSRFAWDIRLISVERLIKLVQIKEKSDDPATVIQIRQLLHPFEYTKIDRIIDVIFTTAVDVANQQEEETGKIVVEGASGQESKQSYTDPILLNAKRLAAVTAFAQLRNSELLTRSRTSFWGVDKRLRVCCTVSKRYDGDYQPYWYVYHTKWDEFLRDGDGYLILCCMDLDAAFALPQSWFAANKQNLNATEKPDGGSYWHIPITTLPDGSLAINLSKVGQKYPLGQHRFSLHGE